MTFVIAGVTGNTGKVAAAALLARGQAVRVIVRDARKGEPWMQKGAEVAVADLGDAAAMTRALAGARGAYLLVPPSVTAPSFRAYQDATVDALAAAIEATGVPHVALLSSVGAQHPGGNGPIAGLHRAEARLGAISGTRSSFIRAAYFMENLGGSLSMLPEGAIPSFLPADFAFDMIATKDIGALAASLLLEGAPATQIIDLSAGKSSMRDVASALSKIVGREISVRELPLAAVTPTFIGMGLPADLAALYQEMLAGIASGGVAFGGGHRRVEGTTKLSVFLEGLLAAKAS